MNWIAKQYPNRGLWQSEGGEYDIYVDDDGIFVATCLVKDPLHQIYPHFFTTKYRSIAGAKSACETHRALLSLT